MDNNESSPTISSGKETVKEDFSWVKGKDYELKKDYLKYPLEEWRRITYEPNFNKGIINRPGDVYEDRVNKILQYEVFKNLTFHKEINGRFTFNLLKNYQVDPNILIKESIEPDFFVYKIESKEFFALLNKRNYMMSYSGKINKDKKYISIIGEIKTAQRRAIKNSVQKSDYIKFIENAKLEDEEALLLMYIYDQSFKLFKNDTKANYPFIICYIPQLFLEECYIAFNEVIDELKSNVKKINLKKKPKVFNPDKEKIESYERNQKYYNLIIGILLLIISYLIFLLNNK